MTKTFREKAVRQKSLTVDEEMVSVFRNSDTMDHKLSGGSTIKSSELEERERLRVEEGGVVKFGIMSSCSMMATICCVSRKL